MWQISDRFSVSSPGVLEGFDAGWILQKLLKILGNYIIFIREILPEMLENVPLQVRQRLRFQHDGTPALFALEVREYLNNVFPYRWIGRGGPVQWPPCSTDLTPMDFFIWGGDEVFGVRDTDRHSRRAGCPCGRSCSNYSWVTIICTQIPAVH